VGPDQDASQGRGAPAAPGRRWDAARVQFSTQRGEGFASKGSAGQLLDDGCLVELDGAEVESVAIPAGSAVGPAPFGQLLLLAADPSRDVVGLLGVDGGQDAGTEQVIGVPDVDLAGDGRDMPGAVADLKQFLQLLGLTHQPVLVIDDHRVDHAFLQVLEHPKIARPQPAGVLGGRKGRCRCTPGRSASRGDRRAPRRPLRWRPMPSPRASASLDMRRYRPAWITWPSSRRALSRGAINGGPGERVPTGPNRPELTRW
jgi:hypothetical protein